MQLECLAWHKIHLTEWTFHQLRATFWRLYLVDDIGAEIIFKGQRYKLKPDHLVLIPPDTPFSSRLRQAIGKLFLHFRCGDTDHCAVSEPVHLPVTATERQLAEQLSTLIKKDHLAVQAPVLAMALITQALSRFPADKWHYRRRSPLVTKVVHHLEHFTAHPPSVSTMAAIAGVSPRQWQRLCRQETGMSPRQLAMSVRMNAVADQLVHSDTSLEQIATDNGFCDRHHLTRVFSKHHGEPPISFRHKHRTAS